MRFSDKTVLITGAGNGIGRASALRFAKEGASVAALDLDKANVEVVAETIRADGGAAIAFGGDITKSEDVNAAVDGTLKEFGKIDILVNCAGAGWKKDRAEFKDAEVDSWRWIVELNINGTLLMTRAVVNHMVDREYGRIINFSSIAAHVGLPTMAAYATTKGAMLSFTRTLAMELGPHNVTVNSVSPGVINENPGPAPKATFLERTGSMDEAAAVVTFLASDDASFVTGADYLVDGGRVLGPRGA